jgi:hypothetical protein
VSDGLVSAVTTSLAAFMVHSDTSVNGQEVTNAPCSPVQPSGVVGCNADETGQPQLVGAVTWTNGTNTITDQVYLQSDAPAGVEPEPASLILFGSGLVMLGGFLRRRLSV